MLSSGCLPASAFVTVVAKFGSFPSAAANSFSVSSAAGDDATSAAIADFTNSVVAICVFLSARQCGDGVPVRAGLAEVHIVYEGLPLRCAPPFAAL